jgi:hypothetical protein
MYCHELRQAGTGHKLSEKLGLSLEQNTFRLKNVNISWTTKIIFYLSFSPNYNQLRFSISSALLKFGQWKSINCKQNARWQHLSRLKDSVFLSLQKIFSC